MRTIILINLLFIVSIQFVISQGKIEPIEIARTPTYNENPVIDDKGNLYVSEPYRGPITKITAEGETSIWSETEGAIGHKIRSDGTHIVLDRVRKEVLSLDSNGEELAVITNKCGDLPLRAPNDLTLDSHGGFYFTDPRVRKENEPIGRVCYVDAMNQSHIVAEWEGMYNGIVLSTDGKILYVAASTVNEIWSYKVQAPGEIGPKELFAKLPEGEDEGFCGPDGITIDDEGNLYVAHFGKGEIQVLNPNGELIHSLPGGQRNVSNVVIGGAERNQLFITGCPGEILETGIVYMLDFQNLK